MVSREAVRGVWLCCVVCVRVWGGWRPSRSYKVQGDYSLEVYLVGLVDDAAGLGGLAVSLAARELGLSKGNMLKRSGKRRLNEFLDLLYIPCTLH